MCNCGIDHSLEKLPEFSLYSNISLDKSECFNQSSTNNLRNCIKLFNKRHDDKYLESDIDKDLLIKIVFDNPVDINGFRILSVGEYSPNKINFFLTNDQNLSFDDVENMTPDHKVILDISENNIMSEEIYSLPTHKFQNKKIVYLYVNDNISEEDIPTRIYYLDFNGKINKSNIDKGIVNCVYESSPQLKDHKQNSDLLNNKNIL